MCMLAQGDILVFSEWMSISLVYQDILQVIGLYVQKDEDTGWDITQYLLW